MRKLASIQCVWKIEPIDGADRIVCASVLGWKCVVNKEQFNEGDLAVYFEVDSFLPIKPEFEFLRSSSYKKTDIMGEGFRLKTQKFRGQVSQGLLLPLSTFPEIPADAKLGDDVTELLGVKKWEVEDVETREVIKGNAYLIKAKGVATRILLFSDDKVDYFKELPEIKTDILELRIPAGMVKGIKLEMGEE